MKRIYEGLFFQNGKFSRGAAMLVVCFTAMLILWGLEAFVDENKYSVPDTMLNAFYGLLSYVGGTKIVGVARTAVGIKKVSETGIVSKVDLKDISND